MSYIRFGDRREFAGEDLLYAFPTERGIVGQAFRRSYDQWVVPADDWIEITMRMMSRSEHVKDTELARIHQALIEETYYGGE